MPIRPTSLVGRCAPLCIFAAALGCSSLDRLDTIAPGETYPPSDPGQYDMFRQHNLDVVNKYRAMGNLPALALDAQLSAFALAGSQELSMDHIPHQHFMNAINDGSIWSSGFWMASGENQGDPNGWQVLSSDPTSNELSQIDQIQQSMYDEGPGTGSAHGHYNNIMSAMFKRMGAGLLEVNGKLYLTNDFSE
jgi:uncharacterized protein YkwD